MHKCESCGCEFSQGVTNMTTGEILCPGCRRPVKIEENDDGHAI